MKKRGETNPDGHLLQQARKHPYPILTQEGKAGVLIKIIKNKNQTQPVVTKRMGFFYVVSHIKRNGFISRTAVNDVPAGRKHILP